MNSSEVNQRRHDVSSLPLPPQVTPCLFINKVDRLVLELGLTPSVPLPLQVTPCLFINKVDRLVLELGLTPSEAEQRLAAIVTHANMVVR